MDVLASRTGENGRYGAKGRRALEKKVKETAGKLKERRRISLDRRRRGVREDGRRGTEGQKGKRSIRRREEGKSRWPDEDNGQIVHGRKVP